jgi:hypothetical protein
MPPNKGKDFWNLTPGILDPQNRKFPILITESYGFYLIVAVV